MYPSLVESWKRCSRTPPPSKLVTLVSSLFTSAYVFLWPQYFPNSPLQLDALPIFDGRCVSSFLDALDLC